MADIQLRDGAVLDLKQLGRLCSLVEKPATRRNLIQFIDESVEVVVIYFPSRFDLPIDQVAWETLQKFGRDTGVDTLVASWNTKDADGFAAARDQFRANELPAVVVTGRAGILRFVRSPAEVPDEVAITITDKNVLSSPERLAGVINEAYDVLRKGDVHRLAELIRKQQVTPLRKLLGPLLKQISLTFSVGPFQFKVGGG